MHRHTLLSLRARGAGPAAASLLSILAALAPSPTPARAQCEGRFLPTIAPDHGLVGQQVNAMTQWDPDAAGPLPAMTIMVGALAWRGSESARNVVTWTPRGADGVWGSLGDGINRHVFDVTVFDGQPVIGVQYTDQPGQPVSTVLRWTGSVWQPMGTIAGPVHALQVYGGQLYAGGDFTIAGTQTFHDIARWNGSSWVGVGGVGSSGRVLDLAVYGGALIAAGSFETMGGVAVSNIASWSGSGWTSLGGGTNNQVTCLAVHGSELIAGGHFGRVAGGALEARFIARWSGSAWNTLGTGMNHRVWAVHSHGGKLYAGGQFTTAGSTPVQHVARWDGFSWQPLGLGTDSTVNCFSSLTTSELYIGGYFEHAGGLQTGQVVRFTSDSMIWTPLGVGMNNGVPALAVMGDYLYAGGAFTTMDGVGVGAITRWNGGAWQPVQNGLYQASVPARVNSLVVRPTGSVINPFAIVAAGGFTHAGGPPTTLGSVAASNIASWTDGVTAFNWQSLGSGVNSAVFCQTMHAGNLYAGGLFSTAGGVASPGLARWTGSAWQAQSLPGFSTSMFDGVYALQSFGGQLIAGGRFDHLNIKNIARLSGSTWSPMGLGMDGEVRALTVFNGELVAGGVFDFAGVGYSHGLARWSGSDWHPIGTGLPPTDVFVLAVYDNDLYIGGTDIASNAAVLRRWDAPTATWTTLFQGAGATTLDALAVYKGELILGGNFKMAQTNSRNWARWSTSGVPWFTGQPVSRSVDAGDAVVLTADIATGYEAFGTLTFQWRRNGVPITDGPGGAGPGGGDVSGASGTLTGPLELTITGARPSDQGVYDCVVATPCGSGVSTGATLTVTGCLADFTGDGQVDFADYLDFLNLFDAGDARADLTGDGQVDFADYLDFLNHYDAGC